jgi:hypothetical protein
MTIKTVDFKIRKTETNNLVSCHSCGEIKKEIFMQGLSHNVIYKNKGSFIMTFSELNLSSWEGRVPSIPGAHCSFSQNHFFTQRFPVFLVPPLSQLFHILGTALLFYHSSPPTKIVMVAAFIIFAASTDETWILQLQLQYQVSFMGSTPVSQTRYSLANTQLEQISEYFFYFVFVIEKDMRVISIII